MIPTKLFSPLAVGLVMVLSLIACTSSQKSDLQAQSAHSEMTGEEAELAVTRSPSSVDVTPEQRLQAVKFFIVDVTALRMKNFREEKDPCKVTNSPSNPDTVVWAIAFGSLNERVANESFNQSLIQSLGFVARNYMALQKEDLPAKLNRACIGKNKDGIKLYMNRIISIMAEE